jgi:hypothetical protein
VRYLETSRVVIIDDLPDEALPVIEALGRLGMGCIYLKGERLEELPAAPLRGVRLVVLDLRLGTTGGAKQTTAMTANVFRRTISPDEGPLIVLLWTKHDEDIPAFQKALFALEPKFQSTILIADLEKPATITPATLRKIRRRISKLADDWKPIDFLWGWEQLAHEAATSTTAIIANQVSSNAGIQQDDSDEVRKNKWLFALRRLLRTLAEAAGGESANEKTAGSDLLEALTAINDDRLEMESSRSEDVDLKIIFEQPSGLNRNQAALLNGMVMVGAPLSGPQEIKPGNVYVLGTKHGPFTSCGIDVTELKSEILTQLTRDADFKKYDDLAAKNKTDATKAVPHKRAREKRRRELYRECKVIVAEVTPSCDFAQGNRKLVRLAAGILVPDSLQKLVPRKESLRPFELIALSGTEGLWMPVFSSRFLYTMQDPQRCLRTRPAFRLRAGILADLRNWYASQSARPGYLSVPGRD